jgi:hypothetical protein
MGNRVKGRAKKKSIRAAIGSDAGSKRKLTRMGKKQKKEHAGLEASFIGRSKCLKMLQITIKDFRRLCILKGVYPREPLGRVPGKKKGQTFYHIKDIRAIAHEPVLEKFREFRAFMKKVGFLSNHCLVKRNANTNVIAFCSLEISININRFDERQDGMRLTRLLERIPWYRPTHCTTW